LTGGVRLGELPRGELRRSFSGTQLLAGAILNWA
jgi:hypothetical protein